MLEKWYERYPLRLGAEKIIMAEYYPQFVLKMDDEKGLFWDGILKTNFDTFYHVSISYPANYPYEKPKLEIIEHEPQAGTPHRFANGSLCVFPNEWNYKQCTAPAAVPLIAGWLALYEVFLRTGERW